MKDFEIQRPVLPLPSMDFLAPEYGLTESCSVHSDLYSLGMLTYAVFNGGKPLHENRNNVMSFKYHIEQVMIIRRGSVY